MFLENKYLNLLVFRILGFFKEFYKVGVVFWFKRENDKLNLRIKIE